jgi:hypothetical protein
MILTFEFYLFCTTSKANDPEHVSFPAMDRQKSRDKGSSSWGFTGIVPHGGEPRQSFTDGPSDRNQILIRK